MAGDHPPGFRAPVAARARAAMLRWVDEAGEAGREFLQVWIRRTSRGGYDIRHRADRGCSADHLTLRGSTAEMHELARTTEAGRHRPMRSTPDLRRGWLARELDGPQLWTVLNALYPAAPIHWFRGVSGGTDACSFAESARRQTGIYTAVRELKGEQLSAAVRASCSRSMCLRHPVWDPATSALEPTGRLEAEPSVGPERAVVPCTRPCSLLIAFAREVVRAEEDRAVLEGLAPTRADRLDLAAALRSGADCRRAWEPSCETADFACRLNPRWLRYWADRLEHEDAWRKTETAVSLPAVQLLWIAAGEGDSRMHAAARPPSVDDPSGVTARILALVACAAAEIAAPGGAAVDSISVVVRAGGEDRDPRRPTALDIRFRIVVEPAAARDAAGAHAESRLHAYRSASGAMLPNIATTWAAEAVLHPSGPGRDPSGPRRVRAGEP